MNMDQLIEESLKEWDALYLEGKGIIDWQTPNNDLKDFLAEKMRESEELGYQRFWREEQESCRLHHIAACAYCNATAGVSDYVKGERKYRK
jgi:hypothetical protein